MSNPTDIVIVTAPWMYSDLPSAAPSVLKAAVEAHGFTAKTFDFNIRFQNMTKDSEHYSKIGAFLTTGHYTDLQIEAEEIISRWVDEILEFNPKYVGISVFTYQSQTATRIMCDLLRKHPGVKIILGGSGIFEGGLNGRDSFAVKMLNENLCDYYIKSEGEIALVELLKGNTDYPGINMDFYEQILDLGSMPSPNFKDYNLTDYPEKIMPITFSRGCVRKCTFCDIHEHWAKYTFRKGEDVANEVLKLNQEYGFRNFYFTDSLINGALREFYKFISILADFNSKLPEDKKIRYAGQYIIRSEKFHKKDYWQKLKDSGAYRLSFGIESGSERVRNHMEKGFSDEDIEYTFRMLKKYNITCAWLFFVGYPTETREDFNKTLELFEKYKDLAGNIIEGMAIALMGVLPGTPIYRRAEELNITIDPKYEVNFIAHDNPESTISERVDRFRIAVDKALELGYPLDVGEQSFLKIISEHIDTYEKRAKVLKKTFMFKKN